MWLVTILAIGILILSGCSQTGPETPAGVSIVNLLATPTAYHGKRVTVIGCAQMAFEGTALYLHCEDYERHIMTNAIWLSFDEARPTTAERDLEGRYIIVEGRFDSSHHGHFRMFPGALTEISRLEPWPPVSLVRPPPRGEK